MFNNRPDALSVSGLTAGAVVGGSTFKIDGRFENAVEPARVGAFMDKVRSLR